MARPSLHVAQAGKKNPASLYNDNFDMMMTYCEEVSQASKDYVDDQIENNVFTRKIGEIVQTTLPLVDAGLHLLDGSVLEYGTYHAFIDYIEDIYDASASYFCTEVEWQQAITDYGVCGKFVYDSENKTVRLPLINGFIEGVTNPAIAGNLVRAGLPNITSDGNQLISPNNIGTHGAVEIVSDFPAQFQGGTGTYMRKSNFDASRSSSIYGSSDTVQPQSIKVLYYIVIATATNADIQVDIDEIATDLNEANKNLSNVVNTSGLRRLVKSSISRTTNDKSWYKLYEEYDYTSGNSLGLWAECGGFKYSDSSLAGDKTVTFPFVADDYEFKDTNYVFIPSVMHNNTANVTANTCYEKYLQRTTSAAILHIIGGYVGYEWTACGYVEEVEEE